MTFEERVRLISRLDELIRRKYRGNPNDYSKKLGISRATFFRLLNYLRTEYEASVCYSKSNCHYEYRNNGFASIGLQPNKFKG